MLMLSQLSASTRKVCPHQAPILDTSRTRPCRSGVSDPTRLPLGAHLSAGLGEGTGQAAQKLFQSSIEVVQL